MESELPPSIFGIRSVTLRSITRRIVDDDNNSSELSCIPGKNSIEGESVDCCFFKFMTASKRAEVSKLSPIVPDKSRDSEKIGFTESESISVILISSVD